jgi:hypothetical protein
VISLRVQLLLDVIGALPERDLQKLGSESHSIGTSLSYFAGGSGFPFSQSFKHD